MKFIKLVFLLALSIGSVHAQTTSLTAEDVMLVAALKNKDAFEVRRALLLGANPNRKIDEIPLLKNAIDTKQENIISYFFEFGMNPNNAPINNEYPLYYAMDVLEESSTQEKVRKNKNQKIDSDSIVKQAFVVNLFSSMTKLTTVLSESKGSLFMHAFDSGKLGYIAALYGQDFDMNERNKKTNKTLQETINDLAAKNVYFNNLKTNKVFIKPLITTFEYDLNKEFKTTWFAQDLEQLKYNEKTDLFSYIGSEKEIELSSSNCKNINFSTSLKTKEDVIQLIERNLNKVPNYVKIDDDNYPVMRIVCNDFDVNYIMLHPNILFSVGKEKSNILMR